MRLWFPRYLASLLQQLLKRKLPHWYCSLSYQQKLTLIYSPFIISDRNKHGFAGLLHDQLSRWIGGGAWNTNLAQDHLALLWWSRPTLENSNWIYANELIRWLSNQINCLSGNKMISFQNDVMSEPVTLCNSIIFMEGNDKLGKLGIFAH